MIRITLREIQKILGARAFGECGDLPVTGVSTDTRTIKPGDLFFAPPGSAFHVADLLTSSPQVRCETAPGGHLGVLTGRTARDTTWRLVQDFMTDVDIERAQATAG